MNGFTTTHWSLIVAAEETGNPSAPEALADLCSTYWGPVYGYLRRRGYDADRAQDLTQGFFSQILERRFFKEARRERGRFRTFLLSGLKYYLSHERERETAQKRGGGMPELPLDFAGAESAYRSEPADEQTPESIFEKRWARSVLDATLSRLRRSLEQSPEPHRSRRLPEPALAGDETSRGRRRRALPARAGFHQRLGV